MITYVKVGCWARFKYSAFWKHFFHDIEYIFSFSCTPVAPVISEATLIKLNKANGLAYKVVRKHFLQLITLMFTQGAVLGIIL